MIIIDLPPRPGPATTTPSSATAAPAATGPNTPSPPTSWRSASAPTTSSPTSCRPRTASSSPGTRTRSPAPPTWPTHPEFADRRTTKTIDGVARHRLVHRGLHPRRAADPAGQGAAARRCGRPTRPSTACTPIPTLDEVLDLARHSRTCGGQPVGVDPETKHPTYFASIGLPLEEPLLRALDAHGWTTEARRSSSRASRPATCKQLDRLHRRAAGPARRLHRRAVRPRRPPATRAPTPTS